MNISMLSGASNFKTAMLRGEAALSSEQPNGLDVGGRDFSKLLNAIGEGPEKAEVSEAAKAREAELREKFQDFVAGTFYKEMLKSLRNTQKKPAYFHGGQAEDIFQSRMDDQVTQDLARKHGDQIAGPLYTVYARGRK